MQKIINYLTYILLRLKGEPKPPIILPRSGSHNSFNRVDLAELTIIAMHCYTNSTITSNEADYTGLDYHNPISIVIYRLKSSFKNAGIIGGVCTTFKCLFEQIRKDNNNNSKVTIKEIGKLTKWLQYHLQIYTKCKYDPSKHDFAFNKPFGIYKEDVEEGRRERIKFLAHLYATIAKQTLNG